MTSAEPLSIVIPKALEEWAPACEMHDVYNMPDCQSPATHVLIHHTRQCKIILTCVPCYKVVIARVTETAARLSATHDFLCEICRANVPSPADALSLEPL